MIRRRALSLHRLQVHHGTRKESRALIHTVTTDPHEYEIRAELEQEDLGRTKYLPTRRAPQHQPAPHGRTLSGLPKPASIGGAR